MHSEVTRVVQKKESSRSPVTDGICLLFDSTISYAQLVSARGVRRKEEGAHL